ncbi:MAG: efflux RND transporter periplasmic adaptor subunit [Chloroflexi bacterium]|uniref:HlyD family secretion protein n=1 Tax=Candidatus Flexifilum breve TaxID=3140694 RepID=UPI00313542F2|nr:efflux RND transporter periplasmic adaptor subunit [Chloroflexota bacterium]
MRVTLALFLLLLLTLAVPAGIGVFSASQGGTSASMETVTLPNGQQAQVPAQVATRIAANGGTFPQVGQFGAASAETTTDTVTSVAVLGSVEENLTADLAFQTSGTVGEVYVQPGDYVEAGTVLAGLDDTDAQIAYRQAQLSLENAQINLHNLLDPPSEDEIRQAELSITSAQASYGDAADNNNDAQVQQAQIKYDQAVTSYNLAVQQRANMNGSEQELALQEAAIGQASFNMEIARLQLEDTQTTDNSNLWAAGVRIQIAQLQYDELLAGADEAQVTNAQLAVEIAEANLASAETTLRRLDLISPIAGVISAVNIEVGNTAGAGTAAITMTDLSHLWLTAPIHELDLDQVTEGMSASIVLDAIPDETFAATIEQIAWIGTESDGIVQYTARFLLNTDDQRIRPGMTGEATIALDA